MADKRCGNGHFIDGSWDICPYCPQEESDADMSVVRPRQTPHARPLPPAIVRPERDAVAVAVQPAIERTAAAPKLDVQKRYVVGWLVGLSGSSRGESFPVRMGRNVLGRDRRSDIIVHDEQASSHHADLVFRPEERRFILMDHNSTNGTYVNDAEIEPRRDLADRDIIRIGSQRYVFMPLCREDFYWDDEGLLQ